MTGDSRAGAREKLPWRWPWPISDPCGRAERCRLSYAPENAAARALCRRFGFRETGEMDGDEVIAVLPL